MLKTKIISLVLVALILIGVPVLASAAIYDPYQNGSVTIDGENEIVSVDLALGNMFWQAYRNGTRFSTSYGQSISYSTKMADFDNEHVVCWVFGNDYYLEVAGIPSDSLIDCHMIFGIIVGNASQTFDALGNLFLKTYDSNYQLIDNISVANDMIDNGIDAVVFDMTCEIPSVLLKGATYWRLDFTAEINDVANESDTTIISVTCGSTDVSIEIPYSSVYQLQQQGEKTNQLLDQIDKQMAANGEKLDDVIEQGQINAGKLDDVNQNLDDVNQNLEQLPGQIGDQMQGIIDAENNKAESDGNKFVDQILAALPDPSTKVLASFKTLTDATSYTGTDAKMPIPALVVPKVGDLIPETTLWGGAEFDFGEYMQIIPENILVLVQSLFTIAIVLFCVYELIGLIRYCLVLRGGE